MSHAGGNVVPASLVPPDELLLDDEDDEDEVVPLEPDDEDEELDRPLLDWMPESVSSGFRSDPASGASSNDTSSEQPPTTSVNATPRAS